MAWNIRKAAQATMGDTIGPVGYIGAQASENQQKGEWNPFSGKGGALGEKDWLGRQIDKVNPWVSGPRKQQEAKEKLAEMNSNIQTPAASPWDSMLGSDGNLKKQYQMANPKDLKATDLTVGKLKSGGKLGANEVGMKSIMTDAKNRYNGVKVNDQGLKEIRSRATGQGPSAWANLATDRQKLDERTAIEDQAQSSAGNMANAMSQVAMRGGLSGGAALRAAKDGANSSNLEAQKLRRQGMGDRLGIGLADETMKTDLLKSLPQAELARAGFDMDKANALTGIQSDEQARNLQKDQFNSTQDFDADKFNVLNTQDVSKYNIGNAMDKDKFNIGNDMDLGKFNTGLDAQTNQFNVGNTLGEVGAKRNNDLEMWKTGMAGTAAEKTANAMAAGGGKK